MFSIYIKKYNATPNFIYQLKLWFYISHQFFLSSFHIKFKKYNICDYFYDGMYKILLIYDYLYDGTYKIRLII